MVDRSATSDRVRSETDSRLVLVEDDENVRRSMTMLLRARGFRIDSYRNGAEFLMMNGQHGGDCLLIDYKMPRIDGLEVLRRIRKKDDKTPAIMITGYFSESLKERAIDAGFTNVVEKPSRPSDLVEVINEALS